MISRPLIPLLPLGTIAWREYAGLFRTGIGPVVIALYLLLCSVWFSFQIVEPAAVASLRPLFAVSQWLLLVVAPAISMRLISEELRIATIEPLLSTPASEWSIAAGKLLGSAAFLLTMLASTAGFVVILALIADPDPGPIITGYLGLALVGVAYLAVGLFMSSLSPNQIVSFIATVFFFIALALAAAIGPRYTPEAFHDILYALSFNLRLRDFARGVIDLQHVAFFAAFTLVFLTASVISLESRRWR